MFPPLLFLFQSKVRNKIIHCSNDAILHFSKLKKIPNLAGFSHCWVIYCSHCKYENVELISKCLSLILPWHDVICKRDIFTSMK